ncbi:MAG: aminoacyl-histidine dipeptidase [Pirellulales bacterium]
MTHSDIQRLEPTPLWQAFVELNAIPRASKKEAAVSQFVAEWGRKLSLETKTDSLGNVLIRKPGSKGYENHATIVLQSHIDMVWQKNSSSDFDFETQGIQMLLDGDWVRARGTTLGADNGIGVATMLSTLASNSMAHPPLECLFTIDEETGMTGAKELDPTWLTGKVLLNLDTEEDNALTIGCAGGADVTAESTYEPEAIEAGYTGFEIHVKGLKGGHSGMEIHLGRANANKVMNRLLYSSAKMFGLRLAKLEGGSLRNAIPRESRAIVFIPNNNVRSFEQWLTNQTAVIQAENSVTDPDLTVECKLTQAPSATVLSQPIQSTLFSVISGVLSGIHRMSPSIAGLVQTSNNLARVIVDQGKIVIMCLARSSVDSERDHLTDCLTSVLEQLDGEVRVSGQYPGWQPEPHSNIVQLMTKTYSELFGEQPHVEACHAGLECGIIGSKSPGMEMISFGPNIRGAHSPDECVQISSVQKFFRYFQEILRRL